MLQTFIHDLSIDDLPATVVEMLKHLTLDLVGVAAAGSRTPLAGIVRRVAATQFGGEVPVLFGSETASASGAAMAGAFTIDAVDAHDGYREAKGHAGCATLPTVLASCRDGTRATSGAEFLVRMALGYEIGCRAGVALHATAPDYHTSGAWMAVACAAIASRGLALDARRTREALGIAEYHGPRSQMMRCIDYPTMVKDGSGWGAAAGVAAAHFAAEGFTGAPAVTTEALEVSQVWENLGSRWLTLEQYVKPEPVCRWAQPAVHAAIALRSAYGFAPEEIAGIDVIGFAAALRLACRHPSSAEEAQYALPYPVAVALVRGAVGPADVAAGGLDDAAVARLSAMIALTEDPGYTSAFPAIRTSEVIVTLTDGRRLASGPTRADGDPERPVGPMRMRAKYATYAEPVLGRDRARAIAGAVDSLPDGRTADLLDLLHGAPSLEETGSGRSPWARVGDEASRPGSFSR